MLFSLQPSAPRPGSWGGSANWPTDNEPGVRDLGFNSGSTGHIKVDPEKSNGTLQASVSSPGRLGNNTCDIALSGDLRKNMYKVPDTVYAHIIISTIPTSPSECHTDSTHHPLAKQNLLNATLTSTLQK